MASCIANVVNQCGSALQAPSHWLLGTTDAPILTTKYIFSTYYATHNSQSKLLFDRVKEIESQQTMQLAMRVLWAVTVVLPVLDLLGAFLKYLSAFDSGIYKQNELDRALTKHQQGQKEVSALGHAVREFVVILQTIGCKKELDEEQDSEIIEERRREVLKNFIGHFPSRNGLNSAIRASCDTILALLEKMGRGDPLQELIEKETSERDTFANIDFCFTRLQQASEVNKAPECLMGEKEGGFYPEWNWLLKNKERLFALCEKIAST